MWLLHYRSLIIHNLWHYLVNSEKTNPFLSLAYSSTVSPMRSECCVSSSWTSSAIMSLKFKHDRRAIMKSSDRAAFYSCALAGKNFFLGRKLSRNVNKRENYTKNAWGFGTRLALDLARYAISCNFIRWRHRLICWHDTSLSSTVTSKFNIFPALLLPQPGTVISNYLVFWFIRFVA